jgi:pimeloyl-ACP methyl ester carboxylesterase
VQAAEVMARALSTALAIAASGASARRPVSVNRASALTTTVLPTCVLWGDSDLIVDPDYGRAFAAAIPGAEFHLLSDTGHVPQVDSPDRLLGAIREFASTRSIG